MESYQAIYDAVRSRISGGDIGAVVRDVAWQAFDISHQKDLVAQALMEAGNEAQRPSVLMRPDVFPDGSLWCALYGENLQHGVCGFGDTPAAACADFDKNWWGQRLAKTGGAAA